MWVQYTDNGQGCCLVLKSEFFDKEDNDTILSESINEDNEFKTKMEKGINSNHYKESYCLYKVEYVGDNIISKYDSHIDDIVDELKNLQTEFDKENVKEIVLNILDQVRFLFKSKDYEHEQEVRLIKFTNDVKYTGDAEGYRVPHVYIDMERELEIDEVVLGPKVSEPIEIANYLYYTGKVDKVTKSKIKYK